MIIFVTKEQAQNFNNEANNEVFSESFEDLFACDESDFLKSELSEFCQSYYSKDIYELAERIDDESGFIIQDLTPHGQSKDVKEIDYKRTLKGYLIPVEDILFGRTLRIKYFKPQKDEPTKPNLNELVIEEIWDQNVDQKFMVTFIDKKFSWFKRDGSRGKTIKRVRVPLSTAEQGLEGPERRNRIIQELIAEVQNLMIAGGSDGQTAYDTGAAFMESIQTEIDSFVSRADNDIVAAIENHPSPLMFSPIPGLGTLRDLILLRIDYFTYQSNNGEYKGSNL